MPENLGKLEKAKFIFLLVVYSIAYFFYAIFVGLYGWITSRFRDK